MAEEARKAAESLYEVLRNAVEALKQQDFAKVKEWLGEPYQQAAKAETNGAVKKVASGLFTHLSNAVEDSRDFWLNAVEAKKSLSTIDLSQENASSLLTGGTHFIGTPSFNQINTLDEHVHTAVEDAFKALKEKFEANESSLHDKGILHYTGSLIQRRWDGTHTPETTVEDALLGGKGLSAFGGIEHLDNPFKKGCAIAVSSMGVGLIVHGGYNMIRAVVPEQESKLELEELGHKPVQEGINWLRLGVGVTEAVAGTATLYAALTGRSILKANEKVDAVALAELTGCGHDHGHGHHH